MSFKIGSRIISQRMRAQSDRYHHQRLSEIRTSKSKDTPYVHLDKRKGQQLEEDRRQQIEKENAVLLEKMTKIMDKKAQPFVNSGRNSKARARHLPGEMEWSRDRDRIVSVKSSYAQQNKSNWMTNLRIAKWRARQKDPPAVPKGASQSMALPPRSANPARQSYQNSIKLFEALKTNTQMRQKKELEDKFNKPEEISERVVLYLKSTVFGEENLLVEISAAYGKLIFLVFDMTRPQKLRRLVVGQKRSLQLLHEFDYNYEALASQLVLLPDSVSLLKKHTDSYNKIEQGVNSRSQNLSNKKQKLEKQNEFLERNFYKEVEKRKSRGASPHREEMNSTSYAHSSVQGSSRQNNQDVKPATASNALKKRFQFQVPEKQKRYHLRLVRKNNAATTIKEERSQSDGMYTEQKLENKLRPKPYIDTGAAKEKARTERKQTDKIDKIDKKKTEKQAIEEHFQEEPVSPIKPSPNKQLVTQQEAYNDEYADEAFELQKPQSRSKHLRKATIEQSKSGSDLLPGDDSEGQEYDKDFEEPQEGQQSKLKGNQEDVHYDDYAYEQDQDNEDYAQGEDGQQYEEDDQHNPQQHPEGEQDQEYVQDFHENMKQSAVSKKGRGKQEAYEEDFEISESKV